MLLGTPAYDTAGWHVAAGGAQWFLVWLLTAGGTAS
jgi:hypothetical protein